LTNIDTVDIIGDGGSCVNSSSSAIDLSSEGDDKEESILNSATWPWAGRIETALEYAWANEWRRAANGRCAVVVFLCPHAVAKTKSAAIESHDDSIKLRAPQSLKAATSMLKSKTHHEAQ
jgi:hypothetical protein